MPDTLEQELARLEGRIADTSVIDELSRVRRGLTERDDGRAPFRLDALRIATPCKERWADMVGDDRVRVCNGCARPVFDLSEMTRAEAQAVLATRGITPCVRLRRRADGTVITADCRAQARHRARTVVSCAIAAGASLFGASASRAEPAGSSVSREEMTGGIEGVIKDGATGEPMIGATVVVSGGRLREKVAAITDENGAYAFGELPPGTYEVTVYSSETTTERHDVRVGIGRTTPVYVTVPGETIIIVNGDLPIIDQGGPSHGITITTDYLTGGIPVPGRTFEDALGSPPDTEPVRPTLDPPPPPPHRPTIEWSSWVRVGYGIEDDAASGSEKRIGAQPDEHRPIWEAAVGADISLPVALRGDLRIGAWAEARTSSGPVLGGEILLETDGLVALRAGTNTNVVTGAIVFGARDLRFVVSTTTSRDDWSATAGVELDPIRALRRLLGR